MFVGLVEGRDVSTDISWTMIQHTHLLPGGNIDCCSFSMAEKKSIMAAGVLFSAGLVVDDDEAGAEESVVDLEVAAGIYTGEGPAADQE